MIRAAALTLAMPALMACASNAVPTIACSSDQTCPFQQCCVQGTCVDPGPVGGCAAADVSQSTLSAETDKVVAGVTTQITVQLRDIYGRPVPNVTPELRVTSACGACNEVSLVEGATDEHGQIHALFSSKVAEDKQLAASIDGNDTNAVTIHVIPDKAVSVGFATAITDTLMGSQLEDVILTRLDQYGNPDAAMADGSDTTSNVMVSLAANAAGIPLRGPSGVGLPGAATPVTLTGSRAPVGNITVEEAGYGLALVAKAPAGSGLGSSQSRPFRSIAPHVTSDDANPLTAAPAVTLTWSIDPPEVATTFSDELAGPLDVISPYEFTPTAHALRARVASKLAVRGLDMEISPFGKSGDFLSPRLTSAAGPAILQLTPFSDGDVLVSARFVTDIVLGGTDTSAVTPGGFELLIARFDPTLETMHWAVVLYGVNEHSGGSSINFRDSVLVSDDEIFVIAEAVGVSGGWQYQESGVKRCVFGGPAAAGPLQTVVARLTGAGIVTGCVALRDDAGGDVHGPAIATTSLYNVVAIRTAESVQIAPGKVVSVVASTPLIQTDGPGGVTITTPTATPDPGCSATLGVLVPFDDNFALAAPAPIITGVMFDPQALVVDVDNTTLLWAGGACSATQPLENGGTDTNVTGRLDGVVLHADFAGTAGARLTLLWQSNDLYNDEITDMQRIDSNVIAIAGTFAGTLNGGGARVFTTAATTLTNGYVAGITRGTLQTLRWGYHLQSSQTVTAPSLVQGADRLVLAAVGKDGIRVVGSDYAVSDVDDAQALPVGIYVELTRAGVIRWSSPVPGAQILARPLLLAEGALAVSASGTKGAVVLGPLDAHPLEQTDTTGVGVEPVTGLLSPWDFIERDVVGP